MKWKLLAILLIVSLLLAACGYVVVEDPDRQTIGRLLLPAANAEGESLARGRAPGDDENTKEYGIEEAAPLTLSRGDKGESVKALQTLLREYGFMSGKADGDFGAKTESAVKDAQAYQHALDEQAEKLAREAQKQALKRAEARVKAMLEALAVARAEDAEETAAREDGNGETIPMVTISANLALPEEKPAFSANGVVTENLLAFLQNDFAVYSGDLQKGAGGRDVRRLQTRLNDMYYLYGGIDGSYGGNTQSAVKYFQRLNGLNQTGIADEETQVLLFSSACKQSDYPMHRYRVEISVSRQKVYVYEWNYGAYSKLVKTMRCTTGALDTPTPLGSFPMGGPCGRWYYFAKFDCWAQYASRITGGILFHSVLYSQRDVSTLRQGSVNALGSRASHGCVRLAVSDAKWIYNNITSGTICRVYA